MRAPVLADLLPAFVVLGAAAGCGSATPSPAGSPPLASAAPPASAAAPLASAAAPPPGATAALDAEIAAVRACPETAVGSYSFSCPALVAFQRARPTPATVPEEDRLFALVRGPRPLRLAALFRLTAQPGPRATDEARALVAIDLARGAEAPDLAEARWLGRVIGEVTLAAQATRESLRALIGAHPSPSLAAEIVIGVGVAHAHEEEALDLVDSFRGDPRPRVRGGVLDAYAETAARDEGRACAAWARGLDDAPNVLRAAALISVTPGCREHHAAVLALAEKRLARDPRDAMALVLPGLCEGADPRLASRVVAVASKAAPRRDQGDWGDLLQAIGRCDPRGPEPALRPWAKRPGEIGFAARRVLVELAGHE